MINASIPLGVQNLQLPNPLEIQRAIREGQTARRQGTMSDLLLAGAQRDEAKAMEADKKARTMQGLLQVNTEMGPNGLTVNKQRLMGDLTRLGMPQEAMNVQKQTAAEEKVARDNKRLEFKTKLAIMGQVLGGHTKENYGVKHNILKSLGFDDEDIPPPDRYDPAAVENALKQGLTYKERLEMEDAQTKTKAAATVKDRELKQKDREIDIDEKRLRQAAQKTAAEKYKEFVDPEGNVFRWNLSSNVMEPTGKKKLMDGQKPVDLADAEAKAAQAITLIDQLVGKVDPATGKAEKPHPGFSTSVGARGANYLWGMKSDPIAGTDGADFKALYDQVTGQAFMEAFSSLKGGGTITEQEGQKASAAITRMKTSQSEGDFVKAAREFQKVIQDGLTRAKNKAAKSGNPGNPGNPGNLAPGMPLTASAQPSTPAVSGLKANPDGSFDYIPGGR